MMLKHLEEHWDTIETSEIRNMLNELSISVRKHNNREGVKLLDKLWKKCLEEERLLEKLTPELLIRFIEEEGIGV